MHYCFVTYGSWETNAGLIRPRHLGEQLAERGVHVSYLIDDLPYNREALKLHPQAQLVFVGGARSPKQIFTRRRAIRSLAPDYVHLLNSHAKSVLALGAMRGFKVVADWDEPPTLKDLGALRNVVERVADRWLRRRADVRIACTAYLQQHLRKQYGLETVYIPHAPYFVDQPQVDSPFPEPTAVYMGNLFPVWDHDILFEAARLMSLSGHKPRLAILGGGPQREEYDAFLREHRLDNITLTGFVTGTELWRHLRHAHVLLFPIRDTVLNRARCPSKIFAYAQARRPLITNRVGEIPYLLGDTPIYIEPTPQAFADEIVRLMRLPPPPDVEYHLEAHNWGERTDRLLEALRATRRESETAMKVLHVISGLRETAGGPVKALLGLASAQRRAGIHAGIAASFVHAEDDAAAHARSLGLDVHQIGPCREPRSRHPQMSRWLETLLRDYDAAHIHGMWEQIQHAAARTCQKSNVPYVMTPHGMLDPWSLSQGALKKKLYLALRMRRNLNRAAAIHFTTITERDLVRPLGLTASKIVEPIGVDFSEFDPLPPRGAFRRRFAQLGERLWAIFLGRIHSKKGFDLLIPAFAQMPQKEPMLVVAGPYEDDRYRVVVESLVRRYCVSDRVLFTGMLRGRERIEALVDSDLFVLPSYQENFGIAVVESLAAGVPVVISDQVNIHYEVSESGGGAVVPTRVDELSSEMSRWLADADLRRSAGERGRAFVRRRFDWDEIARHWVDHYHGLRSHESNRTP